MAILILDRIKYYHALALFILAKTRLSEIQALEKELSSIIKDKRGKAGDAIYDANYQPTREGFNEFLQTMAIDVDWKGEIKNVEQDKEQ